MSDEEQNLSRRERRARAKSGQSDDGKTEDIKDRNQRLRAEAAARRRKLREEERSAAASEGLDAGERVDDALVRGADASAKFLRDNFAWLQWIIIAGLAAGMGFLIYEYRKEVDGEKQGAKLASILATQFGRIAAADPVTPSDRRLVDTRPEFESEAAKAKKAAEAWQALKDAKTAELRLSAGLGRAGALYDLGQNAEARKAYEAVAGDTQSGLHPQLKGRALEGIGFTFEAEQKYEDAKKAFEKLGAVETDEFKHLRKFHIARIEYLLGNRDKAQEMLTELDAKLSEGAGPQGPTDYVGAAVRDLLKTVDPKKAQEEQQALSAAQMQEFLKQFEAMQKQGGGPEIPGMPSGPIELPSTSDEGDLPPEDNAAPLGEGEGTAPEPSAPAPAPAPQPDPALGKAPAPQSPVPQKAAPPEPAPAPRAPAPAAPARTVPAPTPAPAAPAPAPAAPESP